MKPMSPIIWMHTPYLHEAHAPHYLDALIRHFPGCLLGTQNQEFGFGAELLN